MAIDDRQGGVVIERDNRGCYAYCPALKGCQSQGKTVEEAREYSLETLSDEERSAQTKASTAEDVARSAPRMVRKMGTARSVHAARGAIL